MLHKHALSNVNNSTMHMWQYLLHVQNNECWRESEVYIHWLVTNIHIAVVCFLDINSYTYNKTINLLSDMRGSCRHMAWLWQVWFMRPNSHVHWSTRQVCPSMGAHVLDGVRHIWHVYSCHIVENLINIIIPWYWSLHWRRIGHRWVTLKI